ncbi:MAG: phytoene synthase [Saprospiraceae bacterium]|jgi:phytoene synthase
MKSIYDNVSFESSKMVTKAYSTSFSLATSMLGKNIRQDIYNVYGFVRFADEIVDSFHEYDKTFLFDNFEEQLYAALEHKISLNPILNAFQHTVHKYNIELAYIKSFMRSMRLDLSKSKYQTQEETDDYIYGSADVVGLICLQVFVKGDKSLFDELKCSAMKLGSAFQKVNFLRDLKEDVENLGRTYFPNIDLDVLTESTKKEIIKEIEADFEEGYQGIKNLPVEAKLGVYAAYRYYKQLLKKLECTPAQEIKNERIRVPNYKKLELLTRSYVKYQLNLL